MEGLSRLLDLGFLLQRYGITLPPRSKAGDRAETHAPTGEDGPHGRSPWLHHALRGDVDTDEVESTARLSAAFIQAHSRPHA